MTAARSLLALGVCVFTLAACATTYDASLATDPHVTSTTSTLPSGTAAELLPQLIAEASGLSTVMLAQGDVSTQAERVQQLWDASRAEVGAKRPDLLADFLANVARCNLAVQFKRAADADKAAKNLTVLMNAYLGT
jgi:hypothetical protein